MRYNVRERKDYFWTECPTNDLILGAHPLAHSIITLRIVKGEGGAADEATAFGEFGHGQWYGV